MTAVCAVALLWTPVEAAGQSPAAAAGEVRTLGRTPDGQPDVQGFWRLAQGQIMGTYSIETGQSDGDGLLCVSGNNSPIRGPSFVVDPPDGKVPYQPWAA